VVRANPVPSDPSPGAARRWIAGEPERRLRGVRGFDVAVRRAEIGWWLAPEARGRGVGAAAVDLAATWALGEPLRLRQVWARLAPDNVASSRVAAAAGFRLLGRAGGGEVWARP
jgi:RimJ/RimL family protein N-acetyltransferase